MTPTDFAKALSHYLGVYLPGQRNLSTNTLKSYRDDMFAIYVRISAAANTVISLLKNSV